MDAKRNGFPFIKESLFTSITSTRHCLYKMMVRIAYVKLSKSKEKNKSNKMNLN